MVNMAIVSKQIFSKSFKVFETENIKAKLRQYIVFKVKKRHYILTEYTFCLKYCIEKIIIALRLLLGIFESDNKMISLLYDILAIV